MSDPYEEFDARRDIGKDERAMNEQAELPSEGLSVASAREHLFKRKAWDSGSECPCCDQFVKLYRRKIYSTMGACLVWMFANYDRGAWVEVGSSPSWLRHFRDHDKLAAWGLIEPDQEQGTEKRTSGRWRVTDRGLLFVRGQVSVPSAGLFYNGRCFGLEGEPVRIGDVLGVKFNYGELMEGEAV